MLSVVKDVILILIDISLVSFVIYQFLMMLRNEKAIQAIKGIAILVIISFLANLFHLRAAAWLLGKFWTWGVIAFIILFQSELKSALSRLGQRWTILGGDSELQKCISEVSKAAERMAKSGIGGIIVFEREDPLDYFIESGIKLDSLVTWELIVTIFSPESPMRDGAVIIRNSHISASGVILPISRDLLEEDMEFGYRHRAAIGLSRNTDAISVVVSEEKGIISLAVEGKLHRGISSLTLEKMLSSYLTLRSSQREGKR